MPVYLTSHGAAGTVTGSKHLLEVQRSDGSTYRILLDHGMFQGEAQRDQGDDPDRRDVIDPEGTDVVVLSHAHIDHSGLLPRLVRAGYKGRIIATPATIDLCGIMLMDSAHIQEYDHVFDRKRALERGRPPVEDGPLYDKEDVGNTMALFSALDYGQELELAPGIVLRFTDAGHILGSASVHLRVNDGLRELRICFSGDVGRYVDRLLPEPAPFPQADVLICESTYGDRDHSPLVEAEEELLQHVRRVCVERGGRLIIPAFSVGKTQELLYTLNALSNAGRLPKLPVFVDSPLAISATDIARKHAHLFRAEVRAELERDPDLFSFPGARFLRTAESSKALNTLQEPCIIISASGMLEAGRVRHHLYHALPDPRNAVLVVGFCAPGTLGDRLLQGAKEVGLFGDRVPVRAGILRMDFYSAHADRTELLRYLSCQRPASVKRLFLVHGVDAARNAFRERLLEQGFPEVVLAERAKRYRL